MAPPEGLRTESTRPRSFAPREHGAWGQLGFPLLTALALGHLTAASILTVLAMLLVFLCHEPLLIVLGQRGARARRESTRKALVRLSLLGAPALVAGVVAARAAAAPVRWTLAIPVALGLVVVGLIAFKREKTLAGELLVGTTLSACSVPVALFGGVTIGKAVLMALVWVLGFGSATIAVRGVIARTKLGGSGPVWPGLGGAMASAALLVSAAAAAVCPWTVPLAAAPKLACALALALRPPPPQKLRAVGWMLIVASAACAATLIFGLVP